jgi:hypothetical protein
VPARVASAKLPFERESQRPAWRYGAGRSTILKQRNDYPRGEVGPCNSLKIEIRITGSDQPFKSHQRKNCGGESGSTDDSVIALNVEEVAHEGGDHELAGRPAAPPREQLMHVVDQRRMLQASFWASPALPQSPGSFLRVSIDHGPKQIN